MRHLIWFSCGAASTMTAKIVLAENTDAVLAYCDTGGEHPDNKRFMADVEKWLGVNVIVLKSKEYTDHFDVFQKTRWINGVNGARCTVELKKKLRFEFQFADDVQYFGYTLEEKHRADRFREAYPEVNSRFPLIEKGITKADCVGLLQKHNIDIPMMYKLGYNNNNCIGCCKGGAGYWNKIRKDFPEQFKRMAEIEREVEATALKNTYLDELNPKAGRHKDFEISCDFVCQTMDV